MTDEHSTSSGGNGSRGSRPGLPVDPFRVRRAVLRRKWLLLGSGLGGLIVGFVLAKFTMTSSYESTAALKFEGIAPIDGMPPADYDVKSKAAALQRQAVLIKIADEIGYKGDLTTVRSFFRHRVDARAGNVWITAPGDTGEDAAQFAKLVTDVFIGYHEERQADRIEVEIRRINKRIAASEAEGDVARRRYDEFRDTHGIADLSTEQESMLDRAARLRAESELAISEVRALEAQVENLETQLASTPRTRTIAGGASPERTAYQQLRQELATARATLSEDHPRVQALRQQVQQFRSKGSGTSGGDGQLAANATHLAIEEQLRTTKSSLAALRERQRGLVELAEKAQQRVEAFSEIEGEASGLLAEVKVNETLARGLRRTEASLQDALGNPSSGFAVLDPGAVPEYPVRNKKKLVVFVAMPALLFALALLFAFWGEFRGLRVQTPAEVAFWGSGPVLGTTSWPNDAYGLDELIAGLDDYVPDVIGEVLIVGGSPAETPLAAELADRMNSDSVFLKAAPEEGLTSRDPSTHPIRTAPPSGPYPVSRPSPSSGPHPTSPGTALATRPSGPPLAVLRLRPGVDHIRLEAWDGPLEGHALRRGARLADRVLILVHSGTLSALELNRWQRRLGREHGLGYIVIGLPSALDALPDRAGDVAEFWNVKA